MKHLIICMLIILIIVMILMILIKNIEYYSDEKQITILPITVYIVKNMDIKWTGSNGSNKTLQNNITEAHVKTMVDDVNTKFFNKHSIHLDLDIKEYNYSGNDQERNRVLTGLSSLSRSDEDPKTGLSQYDIDHNKEVYYYPFENLSPSKLEKLKCIEVPHEPSL